MTGGNGGQRILAGETVKSRKLRKLRKQRKIWFTQFTLFTLFTYAVFYPKSNDRFGVKGYIKGIVRVYKIFERLRYILSKPKSVIRP